MKEHLTSISYLKEHNIPGKSYIFQQRDSFFTFLESFHVALVNS